MHSSFSVHVLIFFIGISLFSDWAIADNRYVPTFSCKSGPLALKLPNTYPKLLSLGKVMKIIDGEIDDYENYKTTERDLQFNGLTIYIYVYSNNADRYTLAGLKVSSKKWKLGPLQVGKNAKAVLGHDGMPPVPDDGIFEIAGDGDTLVVKIHHGIIKEYSYECYTG